MHRLQNNASARPMTSLWIILSGNGDTFIAHETRTVARSLDIKPLTLPMHSHKAMLMTESVVNTLNETT